jgi:hypothetical protein
VTVSRATLGRLKAQMAALRKALVPPVVVFRVLEQGPDESDAAYSVRFEEGKRAADEARRAKGASFLIIVDVPREDA